MSISVHTSLHHKNTVLIGIPGLMVGGTEIQTLYLVRSLVDEGYRVVVVCYFEWETDMVNRFYKEGATVEFLSGDSARQNGNTTNWKRPSGLKQIVFLFLQFRKMLVKYCPVATHIQYSTPGALPVIILRMLGVRKLIATVHQSGTPYGKSAHWMLRVSARLCSYFTGISRQVIDSWFGKKWPANVRLIYNTIDLNRMNEIKENSDVNDIKTKLGIAGKKVIGTVARLSYIKGIDLLLDAFCLIGEKEPDAVLVIVGKGKEDANLRNQAEHLGLTDRVIFTGGFTPRVALAYMQIFDICVIPSRNEGFGLTVLEAMAFAIPVVAFRVGGVPEIIEHRVSGILVSPANTAELARACIKILGNDQYRYDLGIEGMCKSHHFGFENYKKEIKDLYSTLLKPSVKKKYIK